MSFVKKVIRIISFREFEKTVREIYLQLSFHCICQSFEIVGKIINVKLMFPDAIRIVKIKYQKKKKKSLLSQYALKGKKRLERKEDALEIDSRDVK